MLKYQERTPSKRIDFLRTLRNRVKQYGSDTIVYIDESGFDGNGYRPHGWANKGKKVYGDRSGKRSVRTSLLLAQTKRHRFAPFLFDGTCDTSVFNTWLRKCLIPELKPNQTVVMDNAAIHKSHETKVQLEKAGCLLLFLPPYSSDFNPIEKTFGVLKRKRPFMPEPKTIDELVCSIL